TTVISGDVAAAIADLKATRDGELLVVGSAALAGWLLQQRLVDELNLILCPAVDGARGAPVVFDSTEAESGRRAPVTAMTLESTRPLGGGVLLLRYLIQNGAANG
ncbi:dihydrofolate reductase family protein, partial [Streptococcus suis]